MGLEAIGRREFLQVAAFGVLGALPVGGRSPGAARQKQKFFAAGVRFHDLGKSLTAGQRVTIGRETYRGEECYAIFSSRGQKVGYVPRKIVPRLRNASIVHCYLSAVNLDTVPWKRYEITAVTDS